MCLNSLIMGRYNSEKIEQSLNLEAVENSKPQKKARLNLVDLLRRREVEQKKDKKTNLIIILAVLALALVAAAIISFLN